MIQGEQQEDKPYFAYYNRNELQAVIYGKWKLVFPHRYRTLPEGTVLRNDGIPVQYTHVNLEKAELYNLEIDPSESKDVSEANPEILAKLQGYAEEARKDMGDALTGFEGSGMRKHGKYESPD